jgi:hypothetical protein
MLKLKVNKFIRVVKIHGLKTVLLANVILMIVLLVILLGDVLYKWLTEFHLWHIQHEI